MASPVWHNSVGGGGVMWPGQAGPLLPGPRERLLQTWPEIQPGPSPLRPVLGEIDHSSQSSQSSPHTWQFTKDSAFGQLDKTCIECWIQIKRMLRSFSFKRNTSVRHLVSIIAQYFLMLLKFLGNSHESPEPEPRVTSECHSCDSWLGQMITQDGVRIQTSLQGPHTDLTLGPDAGSAHCYSSKAERNKVARYQTLTTILFCWEIC